MKRIRTIAQIVENREVPFSELALRDLIFRAKDRLNSKGELLPGNGLEASGAIIRMRRKILIDLDLFENWLRGHTAGRSRQNRAA